MPLLSQEKKEKGNVTEDIYYDKFFFGDDALSCENKIINKEIEQLYVADSGYTSYAVNSLISVTNIVDVTTVAKTENKKTITGSL